MRCNFPVHIGNLLCETLHQSSSDTRQPTHPVMLWPLRVRLQPFVGLFCGFCQELSEDCAAPGGSRSPGNRVRSAAPFTMATSLKIECYQGRAHVHVCVCVCVGWLRTTRWNCHHSVERPSRLFQLVCSITLINAAWSLCVRASESERV